MRRPSLRAARSSLLFLILSASFMLHGYYVDAQTCRRVLFIGNSYTGVNNLPQMVHDVAISAGDTLIFNSNNPGGYRLSDHYADAVTRGKIMAGNWQHVVLQGQSQEPVTATGGFLGAAAALYNLIKQYNPCAVPIGYMTWGRKNGDASTCYYFPEMCTYAAMDSALRNSYISMAASNNMELSPVGLVWNYVRQHYPVIELYQADESHPSVAGTYVAACTFYTAIFKKDPSLISFNANLDPAAASQIRDAVREVFFEHLNEWDFKKSPDAAFSLEVGAGNNEIICRPRNYAVRQSYLWSFGDGSTSTLQSPMHNYAANGTYTVTLVTNNCDLGGSHSSVSDTIIKFCSHTPTVYTTHSWVCDQDSLWTQPADSYRWFSNGVALIETTQYLPKNNHPGVSSFSVQATIAGCAESSVPFSQTPEWSGYYFDAIGDPCAGDTVAFAALHINGSLSGTETILWYKNDGLLPSMINHDTLLITRSGKYQCKIINPASVCPIDTTSYTIEYDCGVDEEEEAVPEPTWMMSPNPATEMVNIKFAGHISSDQVNIYNVTGALVKRIDVRETQSISINVSQLPRGIYFLKLMKKRQPVLKLLRF